MEKNQPETPWERIQKIYVLALLRIEQEHSLEESQTYRHFINAYEEIRDIHTACAACTSELDIERLKRSASKFISPEALTSI